MRVLVPYLLSVLLLGGSGPARAINDSIRIVDSGDFSTFGDPAEAVGKSGIANRGASRGLQITSAATDQTSAQVGIEISLDGADQIELRDTDRLFVVGSFGRYDEMDAAALDARLGRLSAPLLSRYGFEVASLWSRAMSLAGQASPARLFRDTYSGGHTPRYAGARVGYSTTALDLDDPADRGFEVAFSSFLIATDSVTDPLSFLDAPFFGGDDKAVGLGFNIGYGGLTVAASYLRGSGPLASGYESYDVGVVYEWSSWATSIAVGGYFADPEQIVSALDVDRMYSVEIGASYAISPSFRVLGRLQFFDRRSALDTAIQGSGGTVYLGTSLGF